MDSEDTIPSELVAEFSARLDAGDKRMQAIEVQLAENTRLTVANAETTQLIKELLDGAKAGFRVLGTLGTGIRWVGGVTGGATAVWVAWQNFKGGGKP